MNLAKRIHEHHTKANNKVSKKFYFLILLFSSLITIGYSQPANDDCTSAITLTQTATCSTTSGTTVGATQTIAASPCDGTADDDVWYKFVAASTNPTIKVVGLSSFDAVVNLRSGSCTGTSIACVDVSGTGGTETIYASGLSIGTTYYIRVYSYSIATSAQGAFTICVYGVPPAPSNDECTSAITLTQTATCSTTSGTTVNATQTIAAISCGGFTGYADDDVWYKFVATSTNPTIKVYSSTIDAVVDLRSGCTGSNIACADATDGIGTETLNSSGLTIGSTYYIRVYSFGSGTSNQGAFTICVYGVPSGPSNNECSNAITLTQSTYCSTTSGTTVNATQTIAASPCLGTADDDVWYKFVATTTNPTIKVVGLSVFDAVVNLRSGSCTGTSVECVDASSYAGTETIYASGLTIGTTYYIRVYSFGSNTSNQGAFTICVYGTTSSSVPTVTTTTPSSIGTTTATSGGNVTSQGSSTVTARGVCWSTSANPVASGSHTSNGTGTGTFTSSITGLSAGTLYHVRAYATNSVGTAYGNDLTFTTTSTSGSACGTEEFYGGFTPPAGWSFTGIDEVYTGTGYYGNSAPSVKFNNSNDIIETAAVSQLSFWIRGASTDAASALLVEGYNGSSWVTVENITNIANSGITKTYNNVNAYIKFRFTYTKSAGNLAFDDLEVICGSLVGIENVFDQNTVNIYPNPAKEEVNVEFELSSTENVTLSLQNYLSQQLYTENFYNQSGSFKKTINTADFARGVYFMKIQVGNNDFTKKIIVIK